VAESFPGNAVRVRLGSAACDVREVATDFPRDQERPAPRNLWPRLPRLWVSGNHALPQLLARSALCTVVAGSRRRAAAGRWHHRLVGIPAH